MEAIQKLCTHTPVTSCTGSAETLEQLATWLDTCDRSPDCIEPQRRSGFLPTRLVCVDTEHPFLVESRVPWTCDDAPPLLP